MIWILFVDRLEGCKDHGHVPLFPGAFELGFGAPIIVALTLVIWEYKDKSLMIAFYSEEEGIVRNHHSNQDHAEIC